MRRRRGDVVDVVLCKTLWGGVGNHEEVVVCLGVPMCRLRVVGWVDVQ